MSTGTVPGIRTLAFGDLETGIWGAARAGAAGPGGLILGGMAKRARPLEATDAPAGLIAAVTIAGQDAREEWRLAGNGAELLISPQGEAANVFLADGGNDGFDQLCRVQGEVVLAEGSEAVDCMGIRRSRSQNIDFARFESVRDVSAWFGPDEGVTVVALRPHGAAGQQRELLTGAVFEAGRATPVAEPRLSTTYTADGLPSRSGLELWLDEEEGESYPHRAAGERAGAVIRSVAEGLDVQAAPFRWHSRGHEGAGVYVLLRRS